MFTPPGLTVIRVRFSTNSRLFPLLYGALLLLGLLVLQLFLGVLFVVSSGALLLGVLLLLPLLFSCRQPRLRTYLWLLPRPWA